MDHFDGNGGITEPPFVNIRKEGRVFASCAIKSDVRLDVTCFWEVVGVATQGLQPAENSGV